MRKNKIYENNWSVFEPCWEKALWLCSILHVLNMQNEGEKHLLFGLQQAGCHVGRDHVLIASWNCMAVERTITCWQTVQAIIEQHTVSPGERIYKLLKLFTRFQLILDELRQNMSTCWHPNAASIFTNQGEISYSVLRYGSSGIFPGSKWGGGGPDFESFHGGTH